MQNFDKLITHFAEKKLHMIPEKNKKKLVFFTGTGSITMHSKPQF